MFVSPPPQIHVLKPNTQCGCIHRWDLWEALGHEGGALVNEISALRKEIPQSSPATSAMQGYKETMAISE